MKRTRGICIAIVGLELDRSPPHPFSYERQTQKAPNRRGQRFTNRRPAKIVYFCPVIHLLRSFWTAFAGSVLDLGSLRHNRPHVVVFLHPIITTIDRNQNARRNAAGDLNALPVGAAECDLG